MTTPIAKNLTEILRRLDEIGRAMGLVLDPNRAAAVQKATMQQASEFPLTELTHARVQVLCQPNVALRVWLPGASFYSGECRHAHSSTPDSPRYVVCTDKDIQGAFVTSTVEVVQLLTQGFTARHGVDPARAVSLATVRLHFVEGA